MNLKNNYKVLKNLKKHVCIVYFYVCIRPEATKIIQLVLEHNVEYFLAVEPEAQLYFKTEIKLEEYVAWLVTNTSIYKKMTSSDVSMLRSCQAFSEGRVQSHLFQLSPSLSRAMERFIDIVDINIRYTSATNEIIINTYEHLKKWYKNYVRITTNMMGREIKRFNKLYNPMTHGKYVKDMYIWNGSYSTHLSDFLDVKYEGKDEVDSAAWDIRECPREKIMEMKKNRIFRTKFRSINGVETLEMPNNSKDFYVSHRTFPPLSEESGSESEEEETSEWKPNVSGDGKLISVELQMAVHGCNKEPAWLNLSTHFRNSVVIDPDDEWDVESIRLRNSKLREKNLLAARKARHKRYKKAYFEGRALSNECARVARIKALNANLEYAPSANVIIVEEQMRSYILSSSRKARAMKRLERFLDAKKADKAIEEARNSVSDISTNNILEELDSCNDGVRSFLDKTLVNNEIEFQAGFVASLQRILEYLKRHNLTILIVLLCIGIVIAIYKLMTKVLSETTMKIISLTITFVLAFIGTSILSYGAATIVMDLMQSCDKFVKEMADRLSKQYSMKVLGQRIVLPRWMKPHRHIINAHNIIQEDIDTVGEVDEALFKMRCKANIADVRDILMHSEWRLSPEEVFETVADPSLACSVIDQCHQNGMDAFYHHEDQQKFARLCFLSMKTFGQCEPFAHRERDNDPWLVRCMRSAQMFDIARDLDEIKIADRMAQRWITILSHVDGSVTSGAHKLDEEYYIAEANVLGYKNKSSIYENNQNEKVLKRGNIDLQDSTEACIPVKGLEWLGGLLFGTTDGHMNRHSMTNVTGMVTLSNALMPQDWKISSLIHNLVVFIYEKTTQKLWISNGALKEETIDLLARINSFAAKSNLESLYNGDMATRLGVNKVIEDFRTIDNAIFRKEVHVNVSATWNEAKHHIINWFQMKLRYENSDRRRVVPVGICLMGQPGVGKSDAIKYIIVGVFRLFCKRHGLEFQWNWSQIYERKAENEYHEGFWNQFATLFDEFLQIKDPQLRTQLVMEYIYMVNSAIYPLHMAELESKKNTFFNSLIVAYTTNEVKLLPPMLGIEEPLAFGRRRHFVIEQTLKEGEGYDVDRWEFVLWKIKYDNSANPATYKCVGKSQKLHVDTIIALVDAELEKHEKEAEDYDKVINKRFEGGIDVEKYDKLKNSVIMFEDCNIEADTLENKKVSKDDRDKLNAVIRAKMKSGSNTRQFNPVIRSAVPQFNPFFSEQYEEQGLLEYAKKLFGIKEPIQLQLEELDDFATLARTREGETNPVLTDEEEGFVEQKLTYMKNIIEENKDKVGFVETMRKMLGSFKKKISKYWSWLVSRIVLSLSLSLLSNTVKSAFDFVTKWAKSHIGVVISVGMGLLAIGGSAFALYKFFFSDISESEVEGIEYQSDRRHRKKNSKRRDKSERAKHDKEMKYLLKHGAKLDSFGGVRHHAGVETVDSDGESYESDEEVTGEEEVDEKEKFAGMLTDEQIKEIEFQGKVLRQIDPRIVDSYGRLTMIVGNSSVKAWVTCVVGRLYLANWHVLALGIASGKARIRIATDKWTNDFDLQNDIQIHYHKEVSRDMCLLELPNYVPLKKGILSHLIKKKEVPKVPEHMLFLYMNEVRRSLLPLPVQGPKRIEIESIKAEGQKDSVWRYEALDTEKGDCGLLYIINNSKLEGCICGIHVGMSKNHEYGLSTVLTYEDVRAMMPQKYFPQEVEILERDRKCEVLSSGAIDYQKAEKTFLPNNCEDLGMLGVDESTRLQSDNPYCKSSIFRSVARLKGVKVLPSAMKPEDTLTGVSPLANGLSKLGRKRVFINHKDYTWVVDYILNELPHGKNYRMLEMEEAVFGSIFEEDVDILNMSSSPGYPYTTKKHRMSKSEMFEAETRYINPFIAEKVFDIYRKLAKGIMPAAIYTVNLKIETRDREKVEEGKTRLFNGGAIENLIFVRMVLGKWIKVLKTGGIMNFSAVGVDVNSGDWEAGLRRITRKGRRYLAGDFKNWDNSLPYFIFILLQCVITRHILECSRFKVEHLPVWFQKMAVRFEIDTVEFLKRCIEFVIHNCCKAIMVCVNQIFQIDSGMPSGFAATAEFNSIINWMLHIIVFSYLFSLVNITLTFTLLHHYFGGLFYGDDSVVGVHEDVLPVVNMRTVSKAFKDLFDMDYTMPDKSLEITVDSFPLEEVTFCQRYFYEIEGRIDAPRDIDVIWQGLLFVSDKYRRRELTIANVEDAMREFACWGSEVFEENKIIMNKILKKHRLPRFSLQYLECVGRFF